MDSRSGMIQSIVNLQKQLVENGTLVKEESGVYLLKEDQSFTSSSGAGEFVLGGVVCGPRVWKTADGRTFAEVSGEV